MSADEGSMGGGSGRRDRTIEETVHDPYQLRHKPPGTAVCPDCGAVYAAGRWARAPRPEGAVEHRCPACQRIEDRFPAGYVTLSGPFFHAHREEILRLVRNEEARESGEHPLKRIMAIEEDADSVVITTTDLHLARRIGTAVHHACQGEMEMKYSPDQYLIRVHWTR